MTLAEIGDGWEEVNSTSDTSDRVTAAATPSTGSTVDSASSSDLVAILSTTKNLQKEVADLKLKLSQAATRSKLIETKLREFVSESAVSDAEHESLLRATQAAPSATQQNSTATAMGYKNVCDDRATCWQELRNLQRELADLEENYRTAVSVLEQRDRDLSIVKREYAKLAKEQDRQLQSRTPQAMAAVQYGETCPLASSASTLDSMGLRASQMGRFDADLSECLSRFRPGDLQTLGNHLRALWPQSFQSDITVSERDYDEDFYDARTSDRRLRYEPYGTAMGRGYYSPL